MTHAADGALPTSSATSFSVAAGLHQQLVQPRLEFGIIALAAGGETGPSGLPLDIRLVVRVTRYVFVRQHFGRE